MITTPTTQDLATTLESQIAASIEQTVPLLPKGFISVFSKVFAGALVILYKYAGFIFLQLFVAHATWEETVINGKRVQPLIEWGRLFGVGDPIPATRAELVISVPVTTLTGSLPGGAQLVHPDSGVLYESVATVPLTLSTVPVRVRAISDQAGGDGSGTVGNRNIGDDLEFANPLANVSRVATVTSVTVVGGAAETIDAYRARIVKRTQAKPQGGAYADYRIWGEEVPGVVGVFPYASDQPGVIEVFVEVDTAIEPDGIAPLAYRTAVYDAIALDVAGVATRRPVNAALNVKAITRTPIDVFTLGLSPDVAGNANAILDMTAAISEYLLSREPFIVGLTSLPREDRVTIAELGGVVTNVVSAYGGTVTTVELQIGGIGQTAYTLGKGEKVKLGTPDFS